MKLKRIVDAYFVLAKMADHIYDYKTAHKLFTLNKELKVHAEFYSAEQLKLAEKYAEKNADGIAIIKADGKFNYADEESKELFIKATNALGDVEVEFGNAVLKLAVTPMVSMRQLEALDGFVEFGAEDE